MKITLPNGTVFEMQDAPARSPEAKDASRPAATSAPAKSTQAATTPEAVATTESKAPQSKRDAVRTQPKAPPVAEKQSQIVRAPDQAPDQAPDTIAQQEPSQPPVSSSPLHSFDRQGGVNDVLDPGRGNPGVYQFVQPKGDA